MEAASGRQFHFVLVHGACHGAWCWYKILDLLQKAGHKATAVDLAASGVHPADSRSITSFEQYNQPLLDLLASLEASEKVVLVGHSLGGLSLLDATGRSPQKIAVAVYISALMLFEGIADPEIMQELRKLGEVKVELEYDKGMDNPPSGYIINRDVARTHFYDQSPSEDILLSNHLRRPLPTAVFETELKHVAEVLESVPRVYVKLEKDQALNVQMQDWMIKRHPPTQVISMSTDHSPFFSAPQQLSHILLHIAESFVQGINKSDLKSPEINGQGEVCKTVD